MSSYNQACRRNDVQEERIVRSGRHVMVVHDTKSDIDYVLCGATAIKVDLSQFSSIPEKKCRDPLGDLLCVYDFEKALSAGSLST